jgi:hypothetical protein
MNIKRSLIIAAVFFPLAGWCDDPKYPVSAIPEELKKEMNGVVRQEQMTYRILSKSKAKVNCLYVVTILNPKAKEFSSLTLSYSKLIKITDFTASVYNAEGKLIKKLKNKDIIDQSGYDGMSLYSDLRIKHADMSQAVYPYTVEFEYEKEYDYLYAIDEPSIIPDEKISLQLCTYEVIYPADLSPRFKSVNLDEKPLEKKTPDGLVSLKWKIEKMKPPKAEPFGPPLKELLPQIILAPSVFEYSGYAGNMSSWQEYGKWQLALNKGRDGLPESTKQKVKELTANRTTVEEKTKVLYEYLQNKTRYVNIALGIGGLQPFDATVVDQMGYGDCKALSNYMIAMLKEAGIKGYYCKIMAGTNATAIQTDFPSHQTNHIIVAVPNEKDTLWLECTSQTNPFGYLGKFTGDRKAIMVTENGGVIVKTTRYNGDVNTQFRTADVQIDLNGDAKARIRTSYSGLQYENDNLDSNLDDQYDDQKKWIQENTEIPNFDINSFSMSERKGKIPTAVVNLELGLRKYASVSGKRIFISPNLMNKSTYIPEKVESRKFKVYQRFPFTDMDTIRYRLPEGIYPEFLPEPIKLSNRFGEYEVSYKVDQGNLIYIRKLKMNKGEFPAESYQELIDFYKAINRSDNTKIVFMSKT